MNPYNQYLENQVMTATPGRLLVMTFDAAIRFAKTARDKMNSHKLDEQSTNICKVQNILLELMASLDAKADPQLAANLYSLYSYMFDQLTQANIKDDSAALDETIEMLIELRTTWVEADTISRTGNAPSETLVQAAA